MDAEARETNEQNKYNARMKIEDFVKREHDRRGGYEVNSDKIKTTVDTLVANQRNDFNHAKDICRAVAARVSDADIKAFGEPPLSDAEIADLRSKLSFYGRGWR
jgi:MoxR-like ATPase